MNETSDNTKSGTWRREADMLLSLIDGFLSYEMPVYASSEFTTGWRFYELCRKHDVKTTDELQNFLGKSGYEEKLLRPNKEEGKEFARILEQREGKKVLAPNPFSAPDWTQPEYLGFWEEVISQKCSAVFFNDRWEYSNGCVEEYLAGVTAGLPLFDRDGSPLDLSNARDMLDRAIRSLEKEGFNPTKLRRLHQDL